MSSTGSNQLTDVFKQRATTRLTPLGGVTDGGGIVTATATGGIVTLTATAAKVLIDALPFTLAAGSASTLALPNGTHTLKLFVNPIREVLAVAALPVTGTIGQQVILVTPAGQFEDYAQDLYIYTAAGWVSRDTSYPTNLDPNAPYVHPLWSVPNSSDFRNLPFNKVTGAALSVSDEKQIMWAPHRGQPVSLPSIEGSYARFSAGFAIANVRVTLTGGTIATPATDLFISRPNSVDLI